MDNNKIEKRLGGAVAIGGTALVVFGAFRLMKAKESVPALLNAMATISLGGIFLTSGTVMVAQARSIKLKRTEQAPAPKPEEKK